jgi:dTDP-glucose 4,6-dehydratase
VITRATNTFGPYQYPEKVIPLFVTNALEGLPLPVYGDGQQSREWLHVDDHCEALETVLERGEPGEIYNVGSGDQLSNLELARQILELAGKPISLIEHVEDRLGHDRRYSVDSSRVRGLGWQPERRWADALAETVAWYREHPEWWRPAKSRSAHPVSASSPSP